MENEEIKTDSDQVCHKPGPEGGTHHSYIGYNEVDKICFVHTRESRYIKQQK